MKKRMRAFPYRKEFFRACLWALCAVVLLSGGRALLSYEEATSVYLSLSLQSSYEGISALYYDVGKGYRDSQVVSAFIRGDNRIYGYLYKIPNKTLYHLRWDPPPSARGSIVIHKMQIQDGSRRPIKRLDLDQLASLHQIEALAVIADRADIRIQEGADDPQIDIGLESPLVVERLPLLARFLGGILFELALLFLGACVLIYGWFRWRDRIGVWFHRGDKVAAMLAVLFVALFGWRCWVLYDDVGYLFLQVTMNPSVNSSAQIFYDVGEGFNENHSQTLHMISQQELRPYRFRLPNKAIYKLRFDPLTTAGRVQISEMKLTDAFGRVLREIPLTELVPIHQIKSINAAEKGIEIVIAEKADDPQIAAPLKEPLNFEGKLPFPLGQWLLALMGEAVLMVLSAFVLIMSWKKRKIVLQGLESPFVQERLPLIYIGSAFGLILAMGFVSGLDVHPDEWNGHIKAAAYYIENWLPPAVDDPRIVSSISVFGVSYLWHVDLYYLFAVKAMHALAGIVSDFYLRMRLANALLFLLLGLVVVGQIKRLQWVVPFLVVSPQVWYVHSYFNNDAFPLFVAMILALQLVDPESSLNRFLAAATVRDELGRGIFIGVLIGLLLSSKLNYWLYIAFLGFWGAWGILFEAPLSQRIPRLKKGLFLFMIALLFYLPIYGYDQYVNSFDKDAKISVVMERHAAFQFKPSTRQNDVSLSYPGLRLKDKGVSLYQLLIESPDWRDLSFMSFFGVYGYMDLVSDDAYYQTVMYVLSLLFLIVLLYAAYIIPPRDAVFLLCVLLFALLTVGQSVYHSWVNDYQPQGRYLFPILPMLMIGLARLPSSFRIRIMPLFGLVFFILSAWSFVLTGLRMIPKIN